MIVVRAIALLVIAAVAGLVFELQNIWPFNHDRVLLLRSIFYTSGVLAIVVSFIPQYRMWGAACLLIGFVTVAVLSKAAPTPMYVITGLVCVGAILGLSIWRPASS